MTYQEENNKLMNSFLEKTFFKGWRDHNAKECGNFRSFEIFLNTKCNLNCKYCYLKRHGEDLYSSSLQGNEHLLKNLEMLLDWFVENRFAPFSLEYFSGEPLVQEAALKGLDMILEKFKNAVKKPVNIIVPTNFTFVLYDDLVRKIELLLQKSREIGIPIILSASFDGKYCDGNRPFATGNEVRDDAYYDKIFLFAKKWNCGLHPMVYSDMIEKWPETWIWFQEQFKKYDLPWNRIYLLEVRNAEWTKTQIADYGKFLEFLIKWTFDGPCNKDKKVFTEFVLKEGYNILQNPLTTIGRGLGCSIQSDMTVRLGDLAWVPCHRTSYDLFVIGRFKTENDKIVGMEAGNPEIMTAIYSFDAKTQPWCSSCLIKPLCSFGCLGSQLETTGDLFTPIPTVCELMHTKMAIMVKVFKELRVLNAILNRIHTSKVYAFEKIAEILENDNIK